MKIKLSFLLICIFFLATSCSYYYQIKTETMSTEELKKYDKINVGWLDLGEEKWEKYGFDSEGNWVDLIIYINLEALPHYLKDFMPEKTIRTVSSINEKPPTDGLVIKFSNADYAQRTSTAAKVIFGDAGGSDTLDLTIDFIDGKTSKVLYNVTISLTSKAATPYSSWGFEARVNNTVYNLARFITESITERRY